MQEAEKIAHKVILQKKELLPEWELSDYLATLELMDAIGCGGQCPSSNNAHGDPSPCMKVRNIGSISLK